MSLLDTFQKFFGGEHDLHDPVTFMSEEEYAKLRDSIAADAEALKEEVDFAISFAYDYHPEES